MGANKKSAFGPPPSPSQINESGNHQRRLRAWLEREFQALPMTGLSFGSGRGSKSLHSAPSASLDRGTTSADHSFLCTYTLAILCSVPAKSDEAIRLLSEFLGMQRAQHFLHETNAFMRSARDVAKYDVVVRYALAGVVCGLSELRVDKRTCQVGKVLLHPLPVVLRATDGGFLGDTQHLTSGDIKGKRRRVDPEDEAACCTLGMEHEPPFVQSRCRTHSREGALRRCSSTDPPPTMFKELLAWDVCMPESSRQANSQTIMRKAPSSSSRQPVPDVDVDERQAALLVELHSKEAPRNLSKHDIGARREMLLKRLMRERALGLQSWRDKGPVDLGQPSRGSSGDASAVRLSASAGLHDETSVTWPPLVPSESAKFHEPQLSSGSSMDGAAHQDFSATNSSDAARASPSGNLDRLDLEQALGKRASEARLRHVLLSRQRSVSLS
ncbi:hypothetical protein IE81DRAFT_39079 [Ceraceosorus guamensis]|uniref:Uncharacterized protein n=1 Tax=Ceraceosorus guamensis TaxID=1522189 RepID=A0A316W3F6_9BASI|nr:hypothetical protein IE81DRAFT_39079 [Ceraceosorus guamensis]PWN44239.1 hypothetical protein IE81DRAFT_39079 [Ceraceosorus guamensis]